MKRLPKDLSPIKTGLKIIFINEIGIIIGHKNSRLPNLSKKPENI